MRGACVLAVGVLLAPIAANAQSDDVQTASNRLVYDASYFGQFSPANALQMVQRVPGFTLEAVDLSVRGFAQAAGNVVINGQRPSSKSDSLETLLSRIPASRVVRIEIAPGVEFGADYAGKPQVANLILTDGGGLAGTLEGRITREYTGRLLPKGSAALSYSTGASTFSASLSYERLNTASEEGFDRVIALPSRNEIEYSQRASRNTEPYTAASLGWALEHAPDRSAHINAKVSLDKWLLDDTRDVFVAGSQVRDELYSEDHLWRTYEISGDVTRPLGGGAIKLNLLGTHRHRRIDDTLAIAASGTSLGGFYQDFDDYRDERLARLAWNHQALAGWNVEIGAEGAFNRLETDLDVFDIDADGNLARVDLPIDDAVVSEYRAELFVAGGRSVARNLRLDLGANFELSRLRVTGDVSAERTLRFLKPKASLDWTPDGWHIQLGVKRTVAQLQFADFVSGASFDTGQIDGGNADLQPQRKWEFLVSAARNILGDGRMKIDLGYNSVSMVQDRIPILIVDPVTEEAVNSGFDAPGNLGSGREWIAKANLDLPLARFGLKGSRLSLSGTYVDTSVQDPYTLASRQFTGNTVFAYSAEFRQDFSTFAWGIEMSGDTGETFYRLNETDRQEGISPRISAFAEYRPGNRTSITLGAENLTDARSRRWRTFYDPDRTNPLPIREEYRERKPHVQLYLSVKHSIG